MTYFNDKEKVSQYIEMAQGFDGKELIDILKKHLKEGSTVLELGMGPGKDLDILKEYYKAYGSDNSQAFLDVYKENHEDSQVLLLDAVTIDTEMKFDCIYTNKVLIHLTKQELEKSIARQHKVLNDKGLLFHSFWRGNKEEMYDGLRFVYYEKDQLINAFKDLFKIIDIDYYTEEEEDDSIYILLERE